MPFDSVAASSAPCGVHGIPGKRCVGRNHSAGVVPIALAKSQTRAGSASTPSHRIVKSCADSVGVRVSAAKRIAFRDIFSRTSGSKSNVSSSEPISSIEAATNPVSPSRTIALCRLHHEEEFFFCDTNFIATPFMQ